MLAFTSGHRVRFIGFFAALAAAFALTGPARAADAPPLRIAADAVPHAEILAYAQKITPGLKLDIIEIPNGVNPNELLAHGDVDANYFQHVPYLHSQEQALGQTFVVAAAVHIEPLGVYSRKYSRLDQVPDGATVAVPNNVTNLSRALFLLQGQGLVKLKAGVTGAERSLATPRDIVWNPKHLKVLEIESPQLPRSLDDVALAVINGNYALEAGLSPAKDALGLEAVAGNPYANVLVTTPRLASDPRIKRLADVLASARVGAYIRERYRGSVIPVHPAGSGS
ncbi:MetQ/NlpA family ABC transporter substrate-binding protein [Burkholderia alba]|uniref:MetQ/NlpA family ABC transporter substrate-binding protein n=1 Tax=Burkholderia alba TaxID=2683677 RepID=UPI002B0534CE|nr:MetQ/NlpA family ABC transporter substrate-binding protein [Burkholderia alba]